MAGTCKILAYTLGNAQGYKETIYELDGEQVSSRFIPDIYLKREKPERVLLFGTAGSGWDALYDHMSDLAPQAGGKMDSRLIDALLAAEGLKQNARLEDLNDLSRRLTECFQVFAGKAPFAGVRHFTVQLLRYGRESDVNTGNYQLLMDSLRAQIEAESGVCEVSFDITHGFRSIPFFSYAILEYLRCLLSDRVRIGRIYYGAYENKTAGNVTAVENYTMVRDVMEWTRAVEEFRHTGRTRTLASLLSAPADERFRKALADFDWAIQCNALDRLTKGFSSLFKHTEQTLPAASPYGDARSLLLRAMRQALFAGDDTGEPASLQWKRYGEQGTPMQRLLIARWLCSIENDGQASLAATEAAVGIWRDELRRRTPADRRLHGKEESELAKKFFASLAQRKGNQTEMAVAEFYHEYNECIRLFRNVFAHNLENDGRREATRLKPHEISERLRRFIGQAMRLQRCIAGQSAPGLNADEMKNLLDSTCQRMTAEP